jgi:excisionase family DNA binding protein
LTQGASVQGSQPKQVLLENSATPLLRPEFTAGALRIERMLTVREVAGLLQVSTATVYKLCTSGRLSHVRVLNVIRVPAGALGSLR